MVARVVLKKSKTYTLGGKRWIKDVPQPVRGEENILAFQQNGYFHVTILSKDKDKAKAVKAVKAVKVVRKKKEKKVSSKSKAKSKVKNKKSKSGKAKLKK